MSESTREHRRQAPKAITCGVIVVSSSRYNEHSPARSPEEANDKSGRVIIDVLEDAGHGWTYQLVPDDLDQIWAAVDEAVKSTDGAVVSGGTGFAPQDVTVEAVEPLFDKPMPGFGELFRRLSYEEIGPGVVLTRATAGIINGAPVFLIPGSSAAARLAMQRIIAPELGHIIKHLREK